MAEFFNPEVVWPPFGAFSMAAVPGNGQVVQLKGQVALDQDGAVVGKGDMAGQLVQVLENIGAVLGAVGGRMADIYALSTFTTDIETFMTLGGIRARYFEPPYPVTTTVEVARLYHPDLTVEIAATAEIPRARYTRFA
ncbi:MAG: RidA family protein [Rhodospirillaceae bacterium]|jgi:2-iminobutanoate/2-iminopropanoate deaminase|nr:RidA family protein [Rhodospirillaceae bacterium]